LALSLAQAAIAKTVIPPAIEAEAAAPPPPLASSDLQEEAPAATTAGSDNFVVTGSRVVRDGSTSSRTTSVPPTPSMTAPWW